LPAKVKFCVILYLLDFLFYFIIIVLFVPCRRIPFS